MRPRRSILRAARRRSGEITPAKSRTTIATNNADEMISKGRRSRDPGRESPSTSGRDSGAASTCAAGAMSNAPAGVVEIRQAVTMSGWIDHACSHGGRYHVVALCQLADGLLKDRPRLVAVLALPLGVEPGLAQLVAERRRIGLVEDHALCGEVLLQAWR